MNVELVCKASTMSERINPTWARWGAECRRLRTLAGMTQAVLAKGMLVSLPSLSAYERGTRIPKREHSQAADQILSTGGSLTRLWVELNGVQGVPESWRDFVELERQAVEIRDYQMALIPGLLQTTDYAHALMRNARTWDTDEALRRLAEQREARLGELSDKTGLWFVLDEAAVRRVVGNEAILREQLKKIHFLIMKRRIRVALVPEYAPHHPGLSGSFRLMNLGDGRVVGYADSWGGDVVISDPVRVNRLNTQFGNLQAEALSPSASAALIQEIERGLH
jgi:transcriptional regulator with XRE-family HTH domain